MHDFVAPAVVAVNDFMTKLSTSVVVMSNSETDVYNTCVQEYYNNYTAIRVLLYTLGVLHTFSNTLLVLVNKLM